MKPRIYIFGCSFSQGVPESDWISWASEFSKLVPNYDVYNFAVAGTSELFHIHILKQVCKIKKPNDIIIFQLTSMRRLTWWNNFNAFDYIQHHEDNLYKLNNSVRENFDRINSGVANSTKFARLWYKTMTEEYFQEQFSINADYAVRNSDYTFFHDAWGNKYKIDSFYEDHKEKFNDYVIDNGSHFGKEGSTVEANWVFQKIKDKI